MIDPPDPARRLRLRVTLKLMMLLAAVAAGVIALRFLGGGPAEAPTTVRFDLAAVAPGAAHSLGWNGRPVIVLHRRPQTVNALGDRLAQDPTPAWFVAFATGTARGCSVVWEARTTRFRESCAEAAWDAAGQPLDGAHAPLEVPPHRITAGGVLVLGED